MPRPAGVRGSSSTAARVTFGAISLSSSIHFALMPNSNNVNPVALPPGRAKLVTKPEPTASVTCTNTIGTLRVAASRGATTVAPTATMTSGADASNSAAFAEWSPASPVLQR